MMTHEEFRAAIDKIGLSQVATARLFGAGDRTARRWASGENDVPLSVAIVLRLMLKHGITPEEIEKIARGKRRA